MNLKLVKRRAEMLDAVSTGLHPSAVISQLAGKFGVRERCLWSDWQRHEKWVPVLLGLEKYAGFCETVEQKLNAVQKAVWSIYLQAGNGNTRVGALRETLMLRDFAVGFARKEPLENPGLDFVSFEIFFNFIPKKFAP